MTELEEWNVSNEKIVGLSQTHELL
jgi:hypothetical protein